MLDLLMIVFGAAAGGTIGSFLACARWRIPRGVSLGGRSFCDSCGEAIPAYWNLPLISWLLLRGRSRCCGVRLPFALLRWEVLCALVGALIVELPLRLYGATSTVVLAGPISLLALGLLAMTAALIASRRQR